MVWTGRLRGPGRGAGQVARALGQRAPGRSGGRRGPPGGTARTSGPRHSGESRSRRRYRGSLGSAFPAGAQAAAPLAGDGAAAPLPLAVPQPIPTPSRPTDSPPVLAESALPAPQTMRHRTDDPLTSLRPLRALPGASFEATLEVAPDGGDPVRLTLLQYSGIPRPAVAPDVRRRRWPRWYASRRCRSAGSGIRSRAERTAWSRIASRPTSPRARSLA